MLVALVFAIAVTSCGASLVTPTATPSPLPVPALKERVMDVAGRIWSCDPDSYPIARGDEKDIAVQRFAEVQADAQTFAVLLTHTGIAPSASYTDDEKLALYREWKALNALELRPVNDGYGFAYLAQTSPGTGERVEGRVGPSGDVTILRREPAGPPMCPICLARGTRIATPSGERAVEELRVGDVVWTLDPHGGRVAAPLVAIGSTPVRSTHEVVRLVLDDGRVVLVSPGHPTAGGGRAGELAAGDLLDRARVVSVERIAYDGGATFDVLPAGATGVYWANGILLGSTLRSR